MLIYVRVIKVEPSDDIHMLYNQSHRASCSSSRSASISTTSAVLQVSRCAIAHDSVAARKNLMMVQNTADKKK